MNEAPFKSWVIANFEMLVNILIIAVWIIICFIQAPSHGANEDVVILGRPIYGIFCPDLYDEYTFGWN